MVLHLMPAPVQPELSNHLKFVYYILYIIWLMSCLPMTRDEWQSDWGVKKQDVSWQITSESLIDRLTCLTRWGMRMKMMTRRSQSIWRIDLIFITKKKHGTKKNKFLGPGVWSYVCWWFVCSRWPDLHSANILNRHWTFTSRRADGEELLWWPSPLPQWWHVMAQHLSLITFSSWRLVARYKDGKD